MTVLLCQRAAAEYLGLSIRSLERYRISGFGPRFVKLAKHVRYRQADLDDFIESRLRSSTSQAA